MCEAGQAIDFIVPTKQLPYIRKPQVYAILPLGKAFGVKFQVPAKFAQVTADQQTVSHR